jgi:hypothetical protein
MSLEVLDDLLIGTGKGIHGAQLCSSVDLNPDAPTVDRRAL